MNDIDSSVNPLNPFSETENIEVEAENIVKAIKLRNNNDSSKRIKFDSDVNKKLTLMMTFWDIDHSNLVAKAINELYANKFLSELNALKS